MLANKTDRKIGEGIFVTDFLAFNLNIEMQGAKTRNIIRSHRPDVSPH